MCLCELAVSQLGSYQPVDWVHSSTVLNVSRKRSACVKALNAEPKRNDSIVASAATLLASGNYSLNSCC